MQGRLENESKINEKVKEKLTTMPGYVTEWHNILWASKVTAASRRDYINKVHHFLSYMSDDIRKVKAKDITSSKVTEYFISVQTKLDKDGNVVNTSDSYQQTVYCALNNFFDFMVSHKYIPTNYMADIKKPKNKDLARINQNRTMLTEKDFRLILNSTSTELDPILKYRDKAILMLFMSTGMRREALRSINISDINFKKQTLTVIDKGDKVQIYKLGDKCIDTINNWLECRKVYVSGPSDALFLSNQGNRISSNGLAKVVCKYSKKGIGREIRPHKLRAGYCSILYANNPDIEFVRRSVGHSDVSTTQRYIVTNGSEREKAAEIINDIL